MGWRPRHRRVLSKGKGWVPTPIGRAPLLRAISATTGAAPEPVPPPMPAVRKTISAPLSNSESSCWLSSAASRPMVGFPPAPRPRVSFLPMFILVWASEWARACRSVLMAMNSTPRNFDRIMRLGVVPKFCPPAKQPHRGRVGGPPDLVTHADGLRRRPDPDGQVEQRLGGLGEAQQTAPPAGEDDAAGQKAVVAAPAHLEAHHLEDLASPRGDDLGKVPAGDR